ncbi:MAG: ABC transporter substrate-binding protein [Bacillus sp. (in: firmicutes)]
MKKTIGLFLFIAVFLMILTGCSSTTNNTAANNNSSKNTLESAKEKGVLVVGSSNDAPFAFIDKDTKKFSGIDAEIMQEVAKRLGIAKVEMKEIKFENLLLELNNKKIDMVTDGMYIKPEREKLVDFTGIWYSEGEALVVHKNSTIAGIDDLKDKTVGGQKGTAFLEFAQKLNKEGKLKQVTVFGSQAELLLALNTGKIDAVITDSAVAGYTITKDASLNLKLVSPYKPESAGNIAAAVRKGESELLDAVNKELENLKKEGFILKVLQKYGLNEDNLTEVE